MSQHQKLTNDLIEIPPQIVLLCIPRITVFLCNNQTIFKCIDKQLQVSNIHLMNRQCKVNVIVFYTSSVSMEPNRLQYLFSYQNRKITKLNSWIKSPQKIWCN